MRRARVKVVGEAYYHVMSRCALQKYLLGSSEVKEMFLKILGRAERFSGVEVANYCVMDNHFHILVKVPRRVEVDDAELDRRIEALYGSLKAERIFQRWKSLRKSGFAKVVEKEQAAFRRRMYDISEFMKTFKQRFSLWYCSNIDNVEGTIWQGVFHSVLVEGTHDALGAVSAYISLNPVRAHMVDDASKYAWSGYGAACAGDRRARAALLSTCFGNAGAAEKWRAYVSRLEMETVEDGGEAAQDSGAGQAPGRGNAVVRIRLEEMRRKDRNISRGIAFGSEEYVKARIGEFSRTGKAGPKPVMFGTGERSTPLFCTGRRSA
jgi:REP element-mobilizing transposase RayT